MNRPTKNKTVCTEDIASHSVESMPTIHVVANNWGIFTQYTV